MYSLIETNRKKENDEIFSFSQLNSNWKKKSNNNTKIKYCRDAFDSIDMVLFEPSKYYNVNEEKTVAKKFINMLQINTHKACTQFCGREEKKHAWNKDAPLRDPFKLSTLSKCFQRGKKVCPINFIRFDYSYSLIIHICTLQIRIRVHFFFASFSFHFTRNTNEFGIAKQILLCIHTKSIVYIFLNRLFYELSHQMWSKFRAMNSHWYRLFTFILNSI